MKQFPHTMVGGISIPRMVAGSNWIFGYSHTSTAADNYIKSLNANRDAIADMLGTFLRHDIDAAVLGVCRGQFAQDGVKLAEDRAGRKMHIFDTITPNMDDNTLARQEAEQLIADSAKAGATFCLIHHQAAEQLVNKNKQTMDRLPDYLSMIRDHGMIPGLSAHMPELVLYADQNEYDVETYIQLYNCMGFLMQVEIEYIHKVIWNAKKPVLSIKPMAAGRCSPFVGITFSFATLREQDMVCVGCMTSEEAEEDIEIALAAIERRPPDLEGRSSPNKTVIMKD